MEVRYEVQDRDESYIYLDTEAAPRHATPIKLVLHDLTLADVITLPEDQQTWLMKADETEFIVYKGWRPELDSNELFLVPAPLICLDETDKERHLNEGSEEQPNRVKINVLELWNNKPFIDLYPLNFEEEIDRHQAAQVAAGGHVTIYLTRDETDAPDIGLVFDRGVYKGHGLRERRNKEDTTSFAARVQLMMEPHKGAAMTSTDIEEALQRIEALD